MYLAVRGQNGELPVVFWSAAGLALTSHGFREWEVLTNRQDAFCINRPLFVLNTLKLLGLGLMIPLLWAAAKQK